MPQAVIPKALPESIFLGGVLIVGGLLESLGINNNKIIYGIPNCIPSSSDLQYVANKAREAKFMRIAGFVCNYPCSMSCNKGYHDGIGSMFKDIYFWYCEIVQSVWLDADASKGCPENYQRHLICH